MDVDQPSTTFEIVADDLDKATHSSMDQTVLRYIGGDPNEQDLSFLLQFIVANSNGKLNPKYAMKTAANTLLSEHPELRIELMQAWGARSFKNIRNLSMCSVSLSSFTERCAGTGILQAFSRPKLKATGSSGGEKILAPHSSMQGKVAVSGFLVTLLIRHHFSYDQGLGVPVPRKCRRYSLRVHKKTQRP